MSLVFVSYSRKDTEFVLKLVGDLHDQAIPVWLDQQDIPVGKRWDVAIQEALEQSTHLLFVMSKSSVESQNVLDEVGFALDEHKSIVPVLLDDCKVPFRVRRFQYTDFRGAYEKALADLLTVLPQIPKVEPSKSTPQNLNNEPQEQTVQQQPQLKDKYIAILQNPNSQWYELSSAITVLGTLNDPSVAPVIEPFLEHSASEIRKAARLALDRIDKSQQNVVSVVTTGINEISDPTPEEPKAKQIVKIVVVGPYNAGKTTFIQSISEIDVVSTDGNTNTTVAMDFGRVSVDDELNIYLFGTPSHRRFDFMWEILAEAMLGFILIIDSTRAETFFEARGILETFAAYAPVPCIIVANKQTKSGAFSPEDIRSIIGVAPTVEIISVDELDAETVRHILLKQLYKLLEELSSDSTNETIEPKLLPLPSSSRGGKPIFPSVLPNVPTGKTIEITRATTKDAAAIAAFLNAVELDQLSEQDVYYSFGKYAYFVANVEENIVGVGKLQIENLVAFVQLSLRDHLGKTTTLAGKQLLDEIHRAANELEAEIALGIPSKATNKIFEAQGYKFTKSFEPKPPGWREAFENNGLKEAMMLQLRKQLVLKPL